MMFSGKYVRNAVRYVHFGKSFHFPACIWLFSDIFAGKHHFFQFWNAGKLSLDSFLSQIVIENYPQKIKFCGKKSRTRVIFIKNPVFFWNLPFSSQQIQKKSKKRCATVHCHCFHLKQVKIFLKHLFKKKNFTIWAQWPGKVSLDTFPSHFLKFGKTFLSENFIFWKVGKLSLDTFPSHFVIDSQTKKK